MNYSLDSQSYILADLPAVAVKKIAIEKAPPPKHWHRKASKVPKIKLVRRETNEEIMHRSILERGFVRLRFLPQILNLEGQYVGFHGGPIAVDGADLKIAKQFIERVRQAIREEAAKLGMSTRELQVSQNT